MNHDGPRYVCYLCPEPHAPVYLGNPDTDPAKAAHDHYLTAHYSPPVELRRHGPEPAPEPMPGRGIPPTYTYLEARIRYRSEHGSTEGAQAG